MKKILFLLLLASLMMLTSCARNDVSEPSLFGPSSFEIVLEGTASPSSLYIDECRNPQTSQIAVKVTRYDGKPVAGKDVIFQQVIKTTDGYYEGVAWGYFNGSRLSVSQTTDSNGWAKVTYAVPGAYPGYPNTNVIIYVLATLSDDSRQQINDWIPLNVYVYDL